jgi:peptidyl-tRNA hydrolase, PTH1 family
VKLIVGLGNPGALYERTRHNVGFMILDRIAAQTHIAIEQRLCDALVGEGTIEGRSVVLAKPQTYMNRSGQAVACVLRQKALPPDDLIVINDDLDLPFGRIRVRPNGSAGGHRGLVSIAEELAAATFSRVRLGIGRPPENCEVIDYVLENFTATELEQLDGILERSADAIRCLLREGIDRTMATYNRA